MRMVRPATFIPVHGESSFLRAHQDMAVRNGVPHSTVIENGQMAGIAPMRNARTFSQVYGAQVLAQYKTENLYNDGGKATGTPVARY